MTAEDREVLREVWGGRIPACFRLATSHVDGAMSDTALASADPYYLMLPRLSYLTLVTEKIRKHFCNKLLLATAPDGSSEGGEMWFSDSATGAPLKWHLPVGVLLDQLAIQSHNNDNATLPWNISVHFGNFPKDQLIKLDSRDLMESHFMSCIKEADQIKHGGRVVSAMQKKDHNQLWQGLQNDKFDQFWAVNRRLMDSKSGSGQAASDPSGGSSVGGGDGNTFKHIPVRLYRCTGNIALTAHAQTDTQSHSDSDHYPPPPPMHQRLVKPVVPLLSTAAPSAEGEGEGEDRSEHDTSSGATTTRLATLKDLVAEMIPDRSCEEVKVVTQGISPEWDTPLQWMSEHLSYPDNFLHICVR